MTMCMFGGGGGGNTAPPDPPIRYSQQKTPTRRDTGDAQERAEIRRKRATSTLLTRSYVPGTDETTGRTLLGT